MGTDKAFIDFQGKKLYEYPLNILKEFCTDVIISGSDKRLRNTGYNVIPDIIDNIGPIGGIYTCLKKIDDEKALIMSCDIPFITAEFIRFLSGFSEEHDITVGLNKNNRPEPLAGIYNKRILKKVEAQINSENYKINRLFKDLDVILIDPRTGGWDPDELFFNVNSSADLFEAKKRKY